MQGYFHSRDCCSGQGNASALLSPCDRLEGGPILAERDVGHLCGLIFGELADSLSVSSGALGSPAGSEHISRIEGYINGNLREKLTLEAVSAAVHLSTKQISRIIKREYGTTFLELVTEKRLAAAEMLLKNSDMKVADIAAQTFPGTETHFYTVFKKHYGISPLKYRKGS